MMVQPGAMGCERAVLVALMRSQESGRLGLLRMKHARYRSLKALDCSFVVPQVKDEIWLTAGSEWE